MLVARNPAFRLPQSGAWFSARRGAAGWRGFGFAVAIAFSALASQASAASDEAARTRAALEAFARAAAALEHGDRATAAQDLDGMAASINSLREVAARYSGLAQTMGSACQERSVAVIDEIQTTHQQERQKQDELAQLQTRSTNLDAQWQQLQSDTGRVNAQRQPLIEEAKYRNRCAAEPGLWFEGGNRCWELSAQDLFNNRYQHVNDELADLQRQQQNLLQVRGDLAQERARLQTEADQARNRKAELEAQRRRLESLDRATRAAATTLSSINMFWSKAETIMQGRMSNGIELLRDVVPMLDKTVDAPLFDDFDKQQIRSLRDSMLDFAQSADSGKNFLSNDLACK
jgi:predicted  nucleic acid-binding Zn-ribbon protein